MQQVQQQQQGWLEQVLHKPPEQLLNRIHQLKCLLTSLTTWIKASQAERDQKKWIRKEEYYWVTYSKGCPKEKESKNPAAWDDSFMEQAYRDMLKLVPLTTVIAFFLNSCPVASCVHHHHHHKRLGLGQ
jgi:small-conductance mechanosensitive channel